MKKLPVALLLLLFCSVAAVSWLSAQTSATAPPAHPVLVVQSTPGGAQVYVDDELLGTTSPEGRLKISTLKPGKHTLRLLLDGRSYGEGQFTLVNGKTLTKAVTLTEQNATGNPAAARPGNAGNGTAGASAGGPSLSDTLDWIRDTLQNDPGAAYGYTEILVQRAPAGNTFEDGSTRDVRTSSWQHHHSLRQEKGCQITLISTYTVDGTHDGKPDVRVGPDNSAYSINLSELDPTAATAHAEQSTRIYNSIVGGEDTISGDSNRSSIVLKAIDNKPVLRSFNLGPDMQQSGMAINVATVTFFVGNQDSAARLVNAFKHAIEVCGGKASAF